VFRKETELLLNYISTPDMKEDGKTPKELPAQLNWVVEGWKQGQWRHVCVVWGDFGARMFIDGRMVNWWKHPGLPERHAELFLLGGVPGQGYTASTFGLDDFRVYNRPLDEGEIVSLFRMGKHRATFLLSEPAKK
jgi:hypothetical protein